MLKKEKIELLKNIKNSLKHAMDEKTKSNYQRFFKEPVKYYGVKSAEVGRISKIYFREIKELKKVEIIELVEELLKSKYSEEAFIAFDWVKRIKEQMEKSDFRQLELWIIKYVDNWAKCDVFCTSTIHYFLERYPELIKNVNSWLKSDNRWVKRASAVSFIVLAKRGELLENVFYIADNLLKDKDDMVQKGYGWLLKEASRKHQKEVFDYVMKHKKEMPRTSLRYAIELMPQYMREKALIK